MVGIPKELLKNRNITEMNVILCFYKQTDFIYDYPIDVENDLLDEQAKILYSLAKAMIIDNKYEVLDGVTIASFVASKEQLKKFIDSVGLDEILRGVSVINADNMDAFYAELLKSNLLINLHKRGFNVMDNLDRFSKMSSENIIDYYEYQLNDSFQDVNLKTSQVSDLGIDEKDVDDILNGADIGLQFNKNMYRLNHMMSGLTKGNFHLLAGYSGQGKTTAIIDVFLIPFALQGIKCCVVSNEMTKRQFQQLLISIVALREFGYSDITRDRIRSGKVAFTKEQLVRFNEVVDFINKNIKHNIKFVEMFSYETKSIKKIVNKLSKIGYEFFAYDTFKSEDAKSDKNWGDLIEISKELFQLAKKNNIAFLATMQLTINTKGNLRYLNSSALSQSKNVSEVCHTIIMCRDLWSDEREGKRFDTKAYNMVKDNDGKYTVKEYVKLKEDGNYQLWFIEKNRSGVQGKQILVEFYGSSGTFKELGFANVQM